MEKDMDQHILEVTTNFKRGATEMLLLSLLTQKERYAYELSKALKQASLGLFDIQGPSLYTALYRLEQKGFVATREEPAGRRVRVYYRLLPAGEVYLKRMTDEYHSISKGIAAVLCATASDTEGKEG